MNKKIFKYLLRGDSSEKGVSILIVFFVMSITMAIVFGVSIILISELKIMKEGYSVAAFYAGDSGIEKTIYYDKKQLSATISGVPTILTRGICYIGTSCSNFDCTFSPGAFTNTAVGGGGCDPATCNNCEIEYKKTSFGIVADESFKVDIKIDSTSTPTINTIKSYGTYKGITRAIELSMGVTSVASPTAPSAPQSLSATAGNTQITLTWLAPSSNGGSAITSYKVYRGTTSGGETLLTTLGNVLTYTNTGLINGIPYYYKVSAVNAVVNESIQSNEASATPVAPATAPSAPQSLSATAGNTQITLTWLAPSSNGGSAITSYKVYRSISSGTEGTTPFFTTSGPVLTYTNTGLTNGTTYYYKVSAVNAVSVSIQSNEASATPVAPAACGGTVQDGDGKTYNTVLIGTQCWFQQNLNVGTMVGSKLNDDVTLQNQTNNSVIEKYCYGYVKQGDAAQIAIGIANCATDGGLYQWAEVMQYKDGCSNTASLQPTLPVQGICPTGWHIPSDAEYKTLEMYLGMTQAQADAIGYRGTDQGDQLKKSGLTPDICSGATPPCGTSGFNALFSGYRNYINGSFFQRGEYSNFWSSTQYSSTNAWRRALVYSVPQVYRGDYNKPYGYSVRCLKN